VTCLRGTIEKTLKGEAGVLKGWNVSGGPLPLSSFARVRESDIGEGRRRVSSHGREQQRKFKRRDDRGPHPGDRLGAVEWLNTVRGRGRRLHFDFLWRYALVLSPTYQRQRQKTISFSRMSISVSFALQNFGFPRGLAPRLQRGPFALQSRHWHRYVQSTRTMPSNSARYRPAPSPGPIHAKRRHPFQRHQFHILLCPNCFTSLGWAASTTPHSTASDPAEEEALLCLEQGTQKLEEGDVEGAKFLYQRSVDIKRNASSLFNLGVTHYHLSSYSFRIRWSLFETQPHEKRSLTKLSILGQLPLSSNHLAQMHIPVRPVSPPRSEPSLLTHPLLCSDLASAYLNHPRSRPDLALQHLQRVSCFPPLQPQFI